MHEKIKLLKIGTYLFISSLWVGQNCVAQCHLDDWIALKEIFESTNGVGWINNEGWEQTQDSLPPKDCNLWDLYGVELDTVSNRVRSIDLSSNRLDGIISFKEGDLQNLTHLNLSNNDFERIPIELSNSRFLRHLDLSKNNLESVPPEIFDPIAISNLNFSNNNFESIPSEIFNMEYLSHLNFSNNDLKGTIPPEIGNLKKLHNLNLSNNKLEGIIPTEISNLTALYFLNLSNNDLKGNLPSKMVCNQNVIDISDNNVSGEIPYDWFRTDEFCDRPFIALSFRELLQYSYECRHFLCFGLINLSNNNLQGSIPDELSKYDIVDLSDNEFTGNIPFQFGNNIAYFDFELREGVTQILYLNDNMLTGSIPPNFSSILDLNVSNNNLSGCFHPQLLKPTPPFRNFSELSDTIWSNQKISDGNKFVTEYRTFHNEGIGICNTFNIGVTNLQNNGTDIQYDLKLDSLNSDFSADRLLINIDDIHESFDNFEVSVIHPNLSNDEVSIDYSQINKVTILINRNDTTKLNKDYSLFRVTAAIVVEDVGSIEITGGITIGNDQFIPFDDILINFPCLNNDNEDLLCLIISHDYENCNPLAKASIEILEKDNPPYTHIWKRNNETIVTMEVDTTMHKIENLRAGEYEVTVFDASNKSITFPITIPPLEKIECTPTSVTNKHYTFLNIYPNPTNGMLNIEAPIKCGLIKKSINIFDVLGNKIQTRQLHSFANLIKVDVSDYPNGVYFIMISDGKESYIRKVLLQK